MKKMKIHMIGIGGVGMAALAVLLKRRGCEVSGCDILNTARTEWLRSKGIEVSIGHNPSHVSDAEVVVVTPAVKEDEPERVAAKMVRCRGEVLAELVNEAEDSIVVCGSHGKTTTSTYIARLLTALGEKVEWAVGGETGGFPVAGGDGGVLVVEGDESDGTLALYHAKTLVVTNVEYDHPDHFPTVASYQACFDTARANAKDVVEQIEGEDDPNLRQAVEVALRRGHSMEEISKFIPSVTESLPDRRFQKLKDGVYIDYAHHPTEIAYTLRRARKQCGGRLLALFQPHRYSRTLALKDDFAKALSLADEVVLCPTYGAFEPPIEGGDVADLYLSCRKLGVSVKLARSCEEAWEHAERERRANDMVLVLGAGDVIRKLQILPPRRIILGMGTNTWKSDLNLNVEYVQTQGPAGKVGASLNIPWMVGIPGSIGGWIKMNAGAHGHSISEVLEAVKVDGEWISVEKCGFGYRTSGIVGEIQDFKLNDAAVASAKKENAADYLAKRKVFPAGTYGSFFKNPNGDFAGRLLEQAGVKNLAVGGAYVWNEHANVIVRGDGATGSDVLALARLMYNAVYFKFGVRLEPEVQEIVI